MRRPTRTTVRRGLAAATITALVSTGATTAVVATAVSSAQADDTVVTDPGPRGSIHEESARQAAADYREKAQKNRATEDRLRAAVVERALDQIGDDYAAGAEGPNAFDCSGLVVYSWKVAGRV